ncbi:Phospholipase A-2-activating protein [Rhodotorula toruloides]|nr:Phospholipase A-2-activating protein [Rhodotorula toruloides]
MFTAYTPRHACPDSPASSRSSEDRFDFHFGSPSSSSTSLDDFDAHYDDEWCHLRRRQDALVHRLLDREKQHGKEVEAWSVRCQTLEMEVKRLAALVLGVERERDEARAQLARSAAQGPLAPAPVSRPTQPSAAKPIPVIDESKPMSRQNPPPCNSFYLLGHCNVPRCRYEHRYELNAEQIEEMRRGAKHHICNAIKNGLACPEGEACIFGHACPKGPACSRERCAFNDEQHRVLPLSRPPLRRR